MAKKLYVVVRGQQPGIYQKWDGAGGAAEQVQGFPGARYKGFSDLQSAREWLQQFDAPDLLALIEENSPEGVAHESELAAGTIVIYTDGAAEPNPGPGGYGAVLLAKDKRRELAGGFRHTTNNRMELLACIEALKALKSSQKVVLYSDSRYVIDGITKGWAESWKQRNWIKSDKKPAENSDLWAQLLELNALHKIEWCWVKGHAGTAENERCDQLAVQAAKGRNLAIDEAYESGSTNAQPSLFGR